MTYSDYQAQISSQKIVLATVNAAKRLMGWELHSGSIYKITSFNFPVIVSIKDSATALTEVSDLASVVAGTFFHDRDNSILYLETSDSANPNSKFMVMVFKNFYSNVPVHAPNDLSTGFEVEWLPIIKASSAFGVELDNQEQLGLAIEGSGSLTFFNDRDYWDGNFGS